MIGAIFGLISNLTELRTVVPTNKTKLFYLTERNKEGHFWYDSNDTTSADNTGTVLLSTGGRRLKRILQSNNTIYPEWFDNI